MSLKAFHIVFIGLSVLLLVGYSAWETVEFGRTSGIGHLLAGLASLVVAGILVVYGVRFVRKLKHTSYL